MIYRATLSPGAKYSRSVGFGRGVSVVPFPSNSIVNRKLFYSLFSTLTELLMGPARFIKGGQHFSAPFF